MVLTRCQFRRTNNFCARRKLASGRFQSHWVIGGEFHGASIVEKQRGPVSAPSGNRRVHQRDVPHISCQPVKGEDSCSRLHVLHGDRRCKSFLPHKRLPVTSDEQD